MDNFQEYPVDVEKEEMAATIRELNRDLDLHDIIVSTYKSEIAYLKAEIERLKDVIDMAGQGDLETCYEIIQREIEEEKETEE